jgi:ABC-type branched-subunit amino acid transport system ATPase component
MSRTGLKDKKAVAVGLADVFSASILSGRRQLGGTLSGGEQQMLRSGALMASRNFYC